MSISRFFHRRRWDDERAREIEAHLAIEIDENVARGMTPDAARLAARRKLGNVTQIREEIYRMNTIGALDGFGQDLRFGLRLLRLNPAFAIVALLSLALGVGANTAIFQLIDAVRIRALPVVRPEQLAEVRIIGGDGRDGWFSGDHPILTNPLWERLRDRQEAFSDLFAWSAANFELSSGGESREAQGFWVSGGFFDTLGVQPAIGRLIASADDRRGCAAPPAVISYGFWQARYAGSASAIGRTLTLDGYAYEIIGVTPPDFFGIEVGRAYDIVVPLCAEPLTRGVRSALDRKDAWMLGVIGRLKPGWSLEKATAHLTAISGALFADTLPNYRASDAATYLSFKLGAFPGGTGVSNLRQSYESPLWLLLATTALVLLIACANLANLMLARATAREREIAVRIAIGASRARIVRQLLAESLLLAAAGAGAGALLAQWLSRVLVAALTTTGERIFVDLSSDARVFAFVALLAGSACVIFGLIPAIRATGTNPGAAVKAGGRGSTDTRERFGLRRALVVVQVSVSLVLVVGALLFVRSFRNLVTVDAGFRQTNLLVAALDFRRAGLADERLRLERTQLLDRVRHTPGVEDAAQVRNVPVGGSFSNRYVVIDGVPRQESVNYNAVSDRYFSTMGTALLAGRDFDRGDTATAPRVAIVTESFARVFFQRQSPIGKTFVIDEAPGKPRPAYTIVGLARDSKYGDLREPFEPLAFVPLGQDDLAAAAARLVIRSRAPASTLASTLAALARDIHPATVVRFTTMESQVNDSLVGDRLMAALSAFFGGLAALLAAIGLFGVMSYWVARRRYEIGIRIALGADRREVVRMVMREARTLLAAGLCIGLVASLVAGRAASALLFGLKPHDAATLATAVAVMSAIAVAASYVPAWRASRVEPAIALHEE